MNSSLPLPVLRQLLNEATPVPWGMDADRVGGFDLVDEDGQFIADRLGSIDRDNAALIVAAVNHLPALLDVVERQAAAIEAVHELVDQCWPARDQELMHPALRPSTFRARFLRALTASGITPTTEENTDER